MFKYRIIENIEELKNMDKKGIIERFGGGDIFGNFYVKINENEIGYYFSEEKLPLSEALKNDLYLFDEPLMQLFRIFGQALTLLRKNNIVKMFEYGNANHFYIFKKNNNDKLIIIYVSDNYNSYNYEETVDSWFILNDESFSEMYFKETVDHNSFEKNYVETTHNFIKETLAINNCFSEFDDMKRIKEILMILENDL